MLLRIDVGGANMPMRDPYNDYALAIADAGDGVRDYRFFNQNLLMPRTSQYGTWGEWFDAFTDYVRATFSPYNGVVNGYPDYYDGQNNGYQGAIEVELSDSVPFIERCKAGAMKIESHANTSGKIPVSYTLTKDGLTSGATKNNYSNQTVFDVKNQQATDLYIPDGSTRINADGAIRISSSIAGFKDNPKVIVVKPTPLYTLDGKYRDNLYPGMVLGRMVAIQDGLVKVVSEHGIYLLVDENDIMLQ